VIPSSPPPKRNITGGFPCASTATARSSRLSGDRLLHLPLDYLDTFSKNTRPVTRRGRRTPPISSGVQAAQAVSVRVRRAVGAVSDINGAEIKNVGAGLRPQWPLTKPKRTSLLTTKSDNQEYTRREEKLQKH